MAQKHAYYESGPWHSKVCCCVNFIFLSVKTALLNSEVSALGKETKKMLTGWNNVIGLALVVVNSRLLSFNVQTNNISSSISSLAFLVP